MEKIKIGKKYLQYLKDGNFEKAVDLFCPNGIVESPIYGTKRANEFLLLLKNDTLLSDIELLGIFEQRNSTSLILYFSYGWTLKNKQRVSFDVVDIIEFDSKNRIIKLKIIYDTFITRKLIAQLNE